MVLALIDTGLANGRAAASPTRVSPVNVADASLVPDAVHRLPMWVPVFLLDL